MHYLIDGHNLIGKMPDISLADADDEVRLILRLQGWVAGAKSRQATVIFDGGALGGVSHRLSSRHITVVFAPAGKTADDLIIQRLARLRNPRQVTVVSSDRRILDAASAARIRALKSETFIQRMGFVFREPAERPAPAPRPAADAAPEKEDSPEVTEAEVAEWLQLFGPEPPPRRRRRGAASVRGGSAPDAGAPDATGDEPAARRPLSPAEYAANAESDNPQLDEAEVAEWLALFSDNRAAAATPAGDSPARPPARQSRPPSSDRLTTIKDASRRLTPEEVDEWMALFGGDPE